MLLLRVVYWLLLGARDSVRIIFPGNTYTIPTPKPHTIPIPIPDTIPEPHTIPIPIPVQVRKHTETAAQ